MTRQEELFKEFMASDNEQPSEEFDHDFANAVRLQVIKKDIADIESSPGQDLAKFKYKDELIALKEEAETIRAWPDGKPADDAARGFPREQEKPPRTMKAIAEYCDVHEDEIETPDTIYTTWQNIESISGMARHTFMLWAGKAGVDIGHDEDGKVQMTLEDILKVKSFRDRTKKGQKKK